ncbi:hypothetical protein L3Y34_016408 [Caenorhabditis briggsae]|uniref:DUF7154 domain-containing protein n=1 Tax=Caenorhabditis briggsae TaxID=6238 RepID=A0AAE9DXJ7_CAEBR|nr:hypothetical protein L3Y34_016408 [Caenorhabditis briggsae]
MREVVQAYCGDGADLYIFDNGKGAKIGDYSLDGFCDPYQQAWQVDTGNGKEQYKELKAVCVLKNKCSQTDPAAFFFAHSADLDKWAFTEIYIQHSKIDNGAATKFAITATVRFDTKTKEEIVFHESDTYFNSRMTGYLYMVDQEKNPPQTFDSSETGSDILDVLERFVDSNHPLNCGSMVLVAMKRSPNEVDISRIVEKLRENQITVIIAAQGTFSGGLHPETMYDLAAKTNGFCAFSHHIVTASQTAPNVLAPFIVYSLSLKVSGTGIMVLPTILLPDTFTVHLSIAVQSTGTANSFQSLKFSFRNKELGASGSVEKTRDELRYDAGPIMNSFKVPNFLLAEPTFFEFTLDYNYSMEDTILIRLISERGIGHWFPYQD